MKQLIKEKFKQRKEAKFHKIIKRKRRRTNKLYSKFKKQDSLLSKLLEEYNRQYLY